MIKFVERIIDRRDLQAEIIGEAAQCRADWHLLLADTAELGKPLGRQAGEGRNAAARGAVEDLHRILICVMRSAVAPCASRAWVASSTLTGAVCTAISNLLGTQGNLDTVDIVNTR